MKHKDVITIWHFDREKDLWEKQVFSNVSVAKSDKISKNGIKQKGFYSHDNMIIRIPTEAFIDVLPGDFVMMGKTLENIPQRELLDKIIEVRDNRRGLVPHFKLVCGNF